jgi:hypothetical protein
MLANKFAQPVVLFRRESASPFVVCTAGQMLLDVHCDLSESEKYVFTILTEGGVF